MRKTLLMAFGIVTACGTAALAQAPAGPEFIVNTYTTEDQWLARVSLDPSTGSFVAVWQGPASGGSGVVGQRFDAQGLPLGGEFQVSQSTVPAGLPSIAHGGTGTFIVTWTKTASLFDSQIVARRFDATGGGSPEFTVNTYTTSNPSESSVAADASGNFVVVWASFSPGNYFDLFGQRFDAGGNRRGAEFAVNTYTTGFQNNHALAMDAAGNFVVVWNSVPFPPGGGDLSTLKAQRFSATGVRLGDEFKVNSHSTSQPLGAAAAGAPDGRFVVAWNDYFEGENLLTMRRFDANGSPRGQEFAIGTPDENVSATRVAMDASGRFALIWATQRLDERRVVGQRFDSDGVRRGRVFDISHTYPDEARHPWPAMDRMGRMVVVWARSPQGGYPIDVAAQRFGLLGAETLAVDTTSAGGSDGNGVLEPGETVDLRPAWQNNSGGFLDLTGTMAGPSGPPGATYTITDAMGGYGAVPDGATQACVDCYGFAVSSPPNRPAEHWDAGLRETIGNPDAGHSDWSLHIGDSFGDVPRTSPFYRFVEAVLHHGVTGGCGPGAYCPLANTTREQMAPFVLIAREGSRYSPPSCGTSHRFADVPASSPFCRWIEELARRGVTSGCGGGNYCPSAAVSREQMAVFVLRTLDPTLMPPACAPPNIFNDVPETSAFCPWIEELARRGVVAGCGGGNYCPTAAVTREQMAVFLTGTFGLTLYGP